MLRLTLEHLETMVQHSREEAPREACGILGGRDGRVLRLFRARNSRGDNVTYYMEPQDQLRIFRQLDEEGLELVALYHSHPASPAYPSATDVAQAFYPDSVYVIVSLASEPPQVRAFRIREGSVQEVTLQLADGPEAQERRRA